MAAPGQTRSGVGFRRVQILELKATGYPKSAGVTAYVGLHVSGARALTLNDPQPRIFQHPGDDAIFATDTLPPTEALSGELVTGKMSDAIDVILTGQLSFLVGESRFFGEATNKRGFEKQVALIAYRQTLDTDPAASTFGQRRWESRVFPKVILVPRPTGFAGEETEVKAYTMNPQFVVAHIWQTLFTNNTEGFTRAQMIRGYHEGKPKLAAYLADGTTQTFNLPTGLDAISTLKLVVYLNGTERTTAITKTTTSFTFTAPLTVANDEIVAWWETNADE